MTPLKIFFTLILTTALLSSCGDDDKKPPKENMVPSATASNFTVQADTTYTGKLAGSDAESDKLTFLVGTAPTKGTLKLEADGNFIYLPNSEFLGSDKFTFTVSDQWHLSAPAAVMITVDLQQVSFNDYSRKAFNQKASDSPLPLNSRKVTQDVTAANAYDDLLNSK
ncbi:hypothetical protein GCM10011613_29510 [Cellvibrio zantedeschiae]|uniref:Lipoprotein n=1 Tax=Cellvibrio zantedeschiae TaxID=1237077 RepID=A0ABQ3B703_9GAMM|nr:Ig-like domain-containing protein [Cellvibrio zantedeschiae]GGY82765.1 hypothetical protein GCM10011613_29510 [Cellvibrio zantedeschiae]